MEFQGKFDKKNKSLDKKNVIYLVVAGLILLSAILLPNPQGLSQEGKIMIGVLLMAGFLWITEAIPLAVTGILVMILQPLLGVMPASDVFSNFGNKAIFFIIGSFMLASAIEKHGLHKRIALKMLSWFERGPKTFIMGVMIVGAFLSFTMEEHAVAVLLLPVLMHILITMKLTPKESNFGIATMLALTYGTSIGSWGTLLGGARNPLTMGFLEEMVGYEITFLGWTFRTIPMVLISLPLVWLVLIIMFPPEIKDVSKAREDISKEVSKMGKMSINEKKTLGIYLVTIGMWIFFSHTIGVAVIALIGVLLMFIFRIIDWEDVEKRVKWSIIFLYGGAITMGIGLGETGAAEWMASNIMGFVGGNPFIALAALIVVAFILTEAMSNTAAVALLLPIGFGIATQIQGLSPVVASFAIALSGGGSFMLVIATPSAAIAYSSGYFSPKHLMKCGAVANIVCMAILFVVAVVYWQWILGM